MSQIFDALRRSEINRSGAAVAEVTAAAQLLEIAERRTPRNPAGEAQLTGNEKDWGHRAEAPLLEQFGPFPTLQGIAPSQSKLVCISGEGSLAAEKFRFLSVRLQHIQQRKSLKRLLITSSLAEEGKSLIAANLACALAKRQGQRVLLVDGDLRRSTQAQLFGLNKLAGLGDLLQGSPDVAKNIYELQNAGVFLLPAGDPTDAPLELIQSRELPSLMDRLNNWFDWIVIDSPPLLPLGDTSIWMRLADGILLVARPGNTEKRHLQRGLEAVEQAKLIGAVINGSRDATLTGNYYYHPGHKATARNTVETQDSES